jgi:hypothetical protein
VTASVALRLLALAAAALLAGLVALAVLERHGADDASAQAQGAVAPGGWYDALAVTRGPAGDAEQTTCGLTLTSRSLGVTHPVLPCHTKILVRYGDQTFFTEVIDTTLKSPRTQFELTESLARRLGLDGIQRVEWRFATGASG